MPVENSPPAAIAKLQAAQDAAATHDTFPRTKAQKTRGTVSEEPRTQSEQLAALPRERGIARLAEIRRTGITAVTVSRLEREGSSPGSAAGSVSSRMSRPTAITALPTPPPSGAARETPA